MAWECIFAYKFTNYVKTLLITLNSLVLKNLVYFLSQNVRMTRVCSSNNYVYPLFKVKLMNLFLIETSFYVAFPCRLINNRLKNLST